MTPERLEDAVLMLSVGPARAPTYAGDATERMVGIVTHVPEVAERVPVRFDVRPGPNGPTLEGGPAEGELPELEAARVSLDVEFPATQWRPLRVPPPECGAVVIFVDGVQRMDARVWVESDSVPRMGLCASYAAGAVRCGSEPR